MNFPTEEIRQLAADGKPKARSTVFAARTGVRLVKRLKDDLLLFQCDANACI